MRCCQLYGNYPSITQVSTHHPGTNLSYSFKRRDSHANKLCLKRLESLASDFHIIHLVRETWMKSRGPSRLNDNSHQLSQPRAKQSFTIRSYQYYSSCNIMGYFKSSVTNLVMESAVCIMMLHRDAIRRSSGKRRNIFQVTNTPFNDYKRWA